MATLQSQFIKFHDTIKLDADDKKVLIEKRKEVEEIINNGVSEFEKSFFNQGSYSTYTGILPIDEGDYDLDRGLKIDVDRHSNSPKEVKKFIFDALASEFGENRVKVKNPCVTVSFPEDNVHIDIAVYCTENDNYFLARGKLNSTDENIKWEEADPVELTKKINNAMENSEDRNQFRRVIRYLKRWKDLKFKNQDNRPTGIGISVFAINNFSVSKKVEDEIYKKISVTIRLAGKNRLDTALSIYGPILEKRKELTLGDAYSSYNGYVYADALTAMPYMYQLNKSTMGPLPLLPYAGEGTSIVFGGYNSVPKLVGERLRIYGADRYKTAVEIAKAFKSKLNKDVDTIVLASGEDYPDALCAGPLASSKNAAILLTKSKTLNEDTREYIKSNTNIKNIIIVGGEKSISSSVENELKTLR